MLFFEIIHLEATPWPLTCGNKGGAAETTAVVAECGTMLTFTKQVL